MKFKVKVDPINEKHSVTNFDCGDNRLNDFIINDALKQKNDGWNTTYVATQKNSSEVIGFFALKGDSISLTRNAQKEFNKDYSDIPAIKIGRFAVDKKYQNKGIGKYLMEYAIGFIVKEVCPLIGGIYITLDTYPDKVKWYEKNFKYKKNTLISFENERFVNSIFPIKNYKTK